jgi:hypothetical protein
MIIDGMGVGRNTTKIQEEFLSPEEIIGINKKLQLYKKKMKMTRVKNDF